MHIDWQDLLAMSLVVAAAGYLGWWFLRSRKPREPIGCSGCTHCPAMDSPRLVKLDRARRPKSEPQQ